VNDPPVIGRDAAIPPLGRVAVGGLGRLVLAGCVLALAAAVVTMSGGAGLGGKLGSLFGLKSQERSKAVTAVRVSAPAPVQLEGVVARVTSRRHASPAPRVRLRSRKPAATGPRRTRVPGARPSPAQPAPPAVPAPEPPPAPPAPSGNVQRAVQTIRDTAGPAIPQAQPVLDQTAAAVGQACGVIGGCP
jgi:hypothetical protein